jgi:hypothetical protein
MSIAESNIKGEIIWSWLEQIKKNSPICQKLEIGSIKISEPERTEVGNSYVRITRLLDRTIIYLAGSLIRGRKLGDDSFSDFRNWLIWGGLGIVETAIANTDELYDRFAAENLNISNPYCENLNELGSWSSQSRDAKTPLSLEYFLGENDEELGEPLTAEFLEKKLPKLWSQFGKGFEFAQNSGMPEFSEVYVSGLGLFKIGDRVFHKKGYGEGEILRILGNEGLVFIRFAHEEKTFWLDPEFIERVKE